MVGFGCISWGAKPGVGVKRSWNLWKGGVLEGFFTCSFFDIVASKAIFYSSHELVDFHLAALEFLLKCRKSSSFLKNYWCPQPRLQPFSRMIPRSFPLGYDPMGCCWCQTMKIYALPWDARQVWHLRISRDRAKRWESQIANNGCLFFSPSFW